VDTTALMCSSCSWFGVYRSDVSDRLLAARLWHGGPVSAGHRRGRVPRGGPSVARGFRRGHSPCLTRFCANSASADATGVIRPPPSRSVLDGAGEFVVTASSTTHSSSITARRSFAVWAPSKNWCLNPPQSTLIWPNRHHPDLGSFHASRGFVSFLVTLHTRKVAGSNLAAPISFPVATRHLRRY